ncbi:hypothetical protein D3C72_2156070 [compost metagenome]
MVTAAAGLQALDARYRQLQFQLTPQHRAGGLGQLQRRVHGNVLSNKPQVDQLTQHAGPVFGGLVAANAVHRQFFMAVFADTLIIGTA